MSYGNLWVKKKSRKKKKKENCTMYNMAKLMIGTVRSIFFYKMEN